MKNNILHLYKIFAIIIKINLILCKFASIQIRKVIILSGYPAHIRKLNNVISTQSVEAHCRNVADNVSLSLQSIGMFNIGYLAGIIHDCGKYTNAFATYIRNAADGEEAVRGSVNHTFAGVIYILENYHDNKNAIAMLTSEIIAYAVGAHHGLFDCIDLYGNSGYLHRLEKSKDELAYNSAISCFHQYCCTKEETDRLFTAACEEMQVIQAKLQGEYKQNGAWYMFGMITRTVLSALIDADSRDTAEFMSGHGTPQIKADNDLWVKLLKTVEYKLSDFKSDTPINKVRAKFSEQCKTFAEKNGTGVYRLNLPTGGSKTLSSLRYALEHSYIHSKKRIFFVIPLLSVLEQNSKVIREYTDADSMILEHHSNVILDREDSETADLYHCFTQSWDVPIIITTLVQLLNTLFSGKRADIRRMQGLCDSVIVIDEIQSLPKKTIDMFYMAVNYLKGICNATVVLCSATQPDYIRCDYPLHLTEPSDLVVYNSELFDVFKRTKVEDRTNSSGMSMEELTDFTWDVTDSVQSVLVICNTKKTSARLYEGLKQNNREKHRLFHLSTAMCMQHRIDVMKAIMAHLEQQKNGTEKRKIVCVATQLVEAGVDFSFQSVIRIRAGIDSVAQAAGRCNRSGEYGNLCPVYIVNLNADAEHLGRLKEIKAASDVTTSLLYEYHRNPYKFNSDLLSDKSISWYYKTLFSRTEISNSFGYPQKFDSMCEYKLFDLLGFNNALRKRTQFNNTFILGQAFKTAGNAFRVFDDDTVDVIVPYNESAKKIIADLCSELSKYNFTYGKKLLSDAQRFTVKLFQYQFDKLREEGLIHFDEHRFFASLDENYYDAQTGFRESAGNYF